MVNNKKGIERKMTKQQIILYFCTRFLSSDSFKF